MRFSLLLPCTLLVLALPLPAQPQARPPWEGGTTSALGDNAGAVAVGTLGIYRDLINPMLSIAAIHAEVGGGVRDDQGEALLRARFVSPFARFGLGLDHAVRDGRTDLLLSLFHPVRRGGLFADGSVARLDYLPGRDHTLMLGVETAVLRRVPMGRTRPLQDRVRPAPATAPRVPPLPLTGPLAEARTAAGWIRRGVLPFPDAGARRASPSVAALHAYLEAGDDDAQRVRSVEGEVRRWHDAVERAFAAAAGDAAAGSAAAVRARDILLHQVLLPYNRLLGQAKRDDTVHGLGSAARGTFLGWLHVESAVARERVDAVLDVFDGIVAILEENRAAARTEWRDSRFVWLPLQYALLPEQHETQAQLDALVEAAVGVRFTDGNFVSYVVNEQFQYQLSRTIRAAREYHVLWTHDFRGRDEGGEPDEMTYRHVLRSYLAAMTQRVREYDRTGRFPVYMVVIDQWFYEVNRGRFFLSLLEDPLGRSLRLPATHAAWEDSIRAAQAELRAAVASSALLQAQRREYGEAWLRSLIRVHVSVTNPADPSFWSLRVVRGVPLPDNMMRDHRKVVFYDIAEDDPYRGEAIYTGAGVGEHYANLSWEDRSLLVRGPAVHSLKAALRETLLDQGMPPERIPHPLQPRPLAPDYDEQVRSAVLLGQQPLRALELHNVTGFGDKAVNVAKAVLYTLMPSGSVVNIPDSLWNSDFWGGAVLGCALRGVRVLMIAPAAENAPADVFGTLVRGRGLLTRLLDARRALAPSIAASGGALHIGLFAPDFAVTDIPAKVRSAHAAFARHPWMHELFGFPQSVYDGLADLALLLDSLSVVSGMTEFEHYDRPKLHLKANHFASREAWSLMTRPEWSAASWEYAMLRIAQVQARSAAVASFDDFPEALVDAGSGMVHEWLNTLDDAARERVVFYTLMGSQNQNNRSMVIDAEVGFLVSGWPAIIPYLDFITIAGQSIWLEDASELDGLLPDAGGLRRRVVNWVRLAI